MTAETVGWTFNPLVAIGLFLAFMFFGYFFGLFEGRGQGYKKRQKEEKEETKPQPAPSSIPESPSVPSDETPILDVSLGMDGNLRLKLDGERRNTSALDSEDRKRLIAVLTQIRPWLEAPKPAASASPASTPPRPVASQKGAQPPQGTSTPKVTPPSKSSTPSLSDRMAQVAGMVPPPKPKPATQSTPAAKPATPTPEEENDKPIGTQSIVMQIDSILQARLTGTALDDRGIRLQESSQGGVLVWVGIEKFEGVDEVTDPEIKAVIRAAITEWENKYTPGF